MALDRKDKPPEAVESGLQDMKLDTGTSSSDDEPLNTVRRTRAVKAGSVNSSVADSPKKTSSKATSRSPTKPQSSAPSPIAGRDEHEGAIERGVSLKMEPGQAPKLSRSTSQKAVAQPPKLFDHLPNATPKATATFEVIQDCIYAAKYLGSSDHDGLECDCVEEWDGSTNNACGEDSDCINRATKMECVEDECNCGSGCQNQRFQRKQYANVSVIETEKKGFGLRTDSELNSHDFIFEYVGEVINENQFRRRMIQYDEEGIKHFYFMSLSKGEFVDATRKGNLGRFCNHSCKPNCYVDKWIVGDKLRMGIFASRGVKAGEELVFNYNVDRYGADPQPCYCGEPNCTGYIGGKTQTERATKLSPQTIEALGIEDGDGWDTAVARKPKKKKQSDDDEEYVNTVEPKALDEKGVTTVMATLVQCKEKWILVKLLGRIQRCDDERVLNRVVKMHGYQILNPALATWKEDFNVVLQILDILNKFPRITRNKITDSKIDETVKTLTTCGDERVQDTATALLKEWSTLAIGYRIPRKKRDENNTSTPDRLDHFQRRESNRGEEKERPKSRSPEPPKGPAAPTGPRNSMPQRTSSFFGGPRASFRPPRPLPAGWFIATSNGKTYYYSVSGQTTWSRPTMPSYQPPPQPKPISSDQRLQEIIDSITKATPKDKATAATPQQQVAPEAKKEQKKEGHEKWRSLSEEKKKKLYENTLFPHVKYIMDKFKGKLPREELKRFGKEIAKKIVNSDFKNNRVEDPSQISSKQERQVKKYVKEYFDKAVSKKREHDKKRAERKSKLKDDTGLADPPTNGVGGKDEDSADVSEEEQMMDMSDDGERADNKSPPMTGVSDAVDGDGLKRKREEGVEMEEGIAMDEDSTPSKRMKSETSTPPPPPPPPPPPADQDEEQSTEDLGCIGIDGFEGTPEDLVTMEDEAAMRSSPTAEPSTSQTCIQTITGEQHVIESSVIVYAPGILQTPSEDPANDASSGNDSQYEGMNPERLRLLGIV